MDRTATEQQALFEHELLRHIAEALRTTIDWALRTQDCSSRLPSLRFIANSFHRHLEHILELEEREGYLPTIESRRYPDLRGQIAALRREHDEFRRRLRVAVDRLEQASPTDYLTVGEVCTCLSHLLEEINDHNQREMLLIDEVRERDERERLLGLL
ncbi:MAG TPA: hemerythrin domain-containing protein [Pirellulales bacterium]|nr:hemerythrin domain-containing protein [Pirellulales bacterium]